MNLVLREAKRFAEAGVAVFPCGPDKRPLIKGGFKSASTNLDRIAMWSWQFGKKWQMIGVPTGAINGIVAIDFGASVDRSLLKFFKSMEGVLIQDTPSGGWHYIYAHPGIKVPNRGHGPDDPDIDIRGDGGYIVAAPSWNEKGRYRWRELPRILPGESPFSYATAEFPMDFAEHLEEKTDYTAKKRKRRVAWRDPKNVEPGERHDALISLAGGLFNLNKKPDEIVASMEQYNAELDEPLPEDRLIEIPKIVEWYMEQAEEQDEEFWDSSPVLRHLCNFARKYHCAPWAVLGSVLARIAVATAPSIMLPGRGGIETGLAPLNFYTALVGEPGAGKDAAMDCAAACFNIAVEYDSDDHFDLGSAEGLLKTFKAKAKDGSEVWERHAALFQEGEVESITSLASRTGNSMLPMMKKAWSGKQLGFGYADDKKKFKMEQFSYRIGLIIGVQPSKAGVFLSDVAGGMPQRLLWMQVIDKHCPKDRKSIQVGGRMDIPLGFYLEGIDYVPESGVPPVIVPMAPAISALIEQVADQAVRTGGRTRIDGHLLQLKIRVAALLAILHGDKKVTSGYWEMAESVMRKSQEGYRACAYMSWQESLVGAKREGRRAGLVSQASLDSQAAAKLAAARHRILGILADGGWQRLGTISRVAGPSHRDYLSDAIESLAVDGLIMGERISTKVGSGGRPGMKYRLKESNVSVLVPRSK